jgi:hypothetical protein
VNHSKLIDELLQELSYRVGIVDIYNKEQQSIISEILTEWGEFEVKETIFKFLNEDEDGEKRFKNPILNRKIKYVGKDGKEREGLVGNLLTSPKDSPGRIEAEKQLPKEGTPEREEINQEIGSQGGGGPQDDTTSGGTDGVEQDTQQGTALKQGGYDKIVDNEEEVRKKLAGETSQAENKNITPLTPKGNPLPKNLESLFSGKAASVKNVFEYLSDEDKQMFRDFEDDYRTLVSLEDSEERKAQAEKMVEKYGLDSNKSSNQPNPKLYMRRVSPDGRKILSGEGNKTSEELRDTIEDALQRPLKGSTKEGTNVKQEVTTTSKPDIGGENKEFIRTAEEDANVRSIFSKEPYSYLDSSMHQLMGPVGDDGNLLYPSSKHSKEYLRQSVEQNKSLQKTIDKLKELEESDGVKPGVRLALEKHQENMKRILENYEIPSKEASDAVGKSYAQMAESLNVESGVLAGAMMKNIAEMALYDTEIAAGDEAYLPSAGTFPSGDKLRVNRNGEGKIETIAAVSVKYGKSGKYKAYGFPGETGQYQKFHPNPEYRDRLNSRPGDDGYDLGVKDEIVDNPIAIKQIISECGFGEAILDEDGLISVIQEMKTEIKKIKEDIGYIQNSAEARRAGKPTAKKQIASQKEKIAKIEKELAQKLEPFINVEKLEQLVGKDNARLMMGRPQVMICALIFGSTLTTSNGLDTIEHNHQEIADGKYISHTDTAETGQTKSLKNWSLTWRAYDDRAGGLIAGANSERIEL